MTDLRPPAGAGGRPRRGAWSRLVVGVALAVVLLVAVVVVAWLAGDGRDAERDAARVEAGRAAQRYAAALGTALQRGSTEIHSVAFPQLDRIGYRASAGTVELTFDSAQVVRGTTVQADRVSRCFAIRSPARPGSDRLPLADISCDDLLPISPTPTVWVVPAS